MPRSGARNTSTRVRPTGSSTGSRGSRMPKLESGSRLARRSARNSSTAIFANSLGCMDSAPRRSQRRAPFTDGAKPKVMASSSSTTTSSGPARRRSVVSGVRATSHASPTPSTTQIAWRTRPYAMSSPSAARWALLVL